MPISIAAIYCPPKHIISFDQFDSYFNTLSHNFIVDGDLNSKHIQWGYHTTNPRGNSLQRVTSKYLKLSYLPTPPTGQHPSENDQTY